MGMSDVTYLDDVLKDLLERLVKLQLDVRKRVLPAKRAPMTLQLREAYTQVEQIRELVNRAKLGKRLGFVKENGTIQPVMAAAPEPVNDAE